jgi:hypothetical protein
MLRVRPWASPLGKGNGASACSGARAGEGDGALQSPYGELLRRFEAGRQTAVEWEETEELLAAAAPAGSRCG